MTKFQKQMLTIAAAGALTAVTALPAMAFENEFHGMFAIKTFMSNIDGNANGSLGLTQKTLKNNNYTDQRTRIQYTAKASDDLKLVTHFEMNTAWGDSDGGDIDTDGYNFQVKHAYLDFNAGKSLNVKLGQQAYKDALAGLYVDADLPMAYATYKAGSYTLGLGYSRFNDNAVDGGLADVQFRGDKAADLFVIDNNFAINKNTSVGLSYYLNADNYQAAAVVVSPTAVAAGAKDGSRKIHTLALTAGTKLGDLSLSGFAAMQAGYDHNNISGAKTSYHGWAANTLAKMKVGSGSARAGFLFTSGDNNADAGHNNGWQTLSSDSSAAVQNSYNESGMMLLVRNTSMAGTSTDNYLRKPITNIALAHIGYDAALTEKMYVNGNVGFAWLPSSAQIYGASGSVTVPGILVGGNAISQAAQATNGSDFLGTELNLEAGYKLYKNLTLKAQAAYVILGGAYKNTAIDANGAPADPANPYSIRLGAAYSF